MTVTLTQLADAQHRADTVQRTVEALNDSTKVLSDNTVRDLLLYAQAGARDYAVDKTVMHHVSSQHHENGRLKDLVVKLWNRQLALQQDLDQLRKYCGFATAEALKEAVEAGQTKPLPATVKPAVHIDANAAKKAQMIAELEARAAKAKADAAAKDTQEAAQK